MIETLRKNEAVILYGQFSSIDDDEKKKGVEFLETEYKLEKNEYPFRSPDFNPTAALWSAEIIYKVAQLILYREHKSEELTHLLPPFAGELTDSAMLSADLCLRFLPEMLEQLKLIDSQDSLIVLLEGYLHQWHYSGIGATTEIEELDFSIITSNACLFQLYCNRIIDKKQLNFANHPQMSERIKASLGIYHQTFWKELTTSTNLYE